MQMLWQTENLFISLRNSKFITKFKDDKKKDECMDNYERLRNDASWDEWMLAKVLPAFNDNTILDRKY